MNLSGQLTSPKVAHRCQKMTQKVVTMEKIGSKNVVANGDCNDASGDCNSAGGHGDVSLVAGKGPETRRRWAKGRHKEKSKNVRKSLKINEWKARANIDNFDLAIWHNLNIRQLLYLIGPTYRYILYIQIDIKLISKPSKIKTDSSLIFFEAGQHMRYTHYLN